jgi:hypothetical protein
MSDEQLVATNEELVKRLRDMDGDSMSIKTLDEAADRIEELEAKLAKAVEALREIAGECGCSTARATLAEIKGDSHD